MIDKRIFVEKKSGFQVEAESLQKELNEFLGINIRELRIINVYDIFNVDEELLNRAEESIFAERVTDNIYSELEIKDYNLYAVELLPGQFDQRADAAIQCFNLLEPENEVSVKSGKIYLWQGASLEAEITAIKKYLLNPIESREKNLQVFALEENLYPENEVVLVDNFTNLAGDELKNLSTSLGLAMSLEDLLHIQKYFKTLNRQPTLTELKVLDTYWSDHCRHTTFLTEIENVSIEKSFISKAIEKTYDLYKDLRKEVGRENKPENLMDMATIVMRHQRAKGMLADVEFSEENNACSIFVYVDVNGVYEKWLVQFKNETHNHPTEIEPFGGAATCLGGAIRDPLSGRSYIYQAMRITGAGDITEPLENTLAGKLPQRLISKTAAHGYSSYGNQIGLATTYVKEVFHKDYVAKRLEVGAVVGASPYSAIRRESPAPKDIVLMIGGRTGRDGIGGATGSSKRHNKKSVEVAASEVQKGNAPEERKLQRLFRNKEVTKLIKKSNDFGAGGLSVAVGELADGVHIYLDKVPLKYQGLTGMEIALSESQERIAVVIEAKDVEKFKAYCYEENIEVTHVADVTEEKRLYMTYGNKVFVDLERSFLDTNGATVKTNVLLKKPSLPNPFVKEKVINYKEELLNVMQDLNVASQQGLVEMFDASIGRTTVLMPYGGKYQLTQAECSVQKVSVQKGDTDTITLLSHGFNPYLAEWSQFHGASYAVVESLARIVATGGNWRKIKFSFQEYFERLGKVEEKWGAPFSALLGAIEAQNEFGLAAIGGKDSMSGTFENITVPPTFISFALTTGKVQGVLSPEFKNLNSYVYVLEHNPKEDFTPNYKQLKNNFDILESLRESGDLLAISSVKDKGLLETFASMSLGNKIGLEVENEEILAKLNSLSYGTFVVESSKALENKEFIFVGKTRSGYIQIAEEKIDIDEIISTWQKPLEKVYPTTYKHEKNYKEYALKDLLQPKKEIVTSSNICLGKAKPKVVIPVFYGTNCEYDIENSFVRAGAEVEILPLGTLNPEMFRESILGLEKAINSAQILALAGGFSAGDEPDGSGKYIAVFLQNQKIRQAIENLLLRDGLIIGICNGFQALVKSGLLPYGQFDNVIETSPTLFRNDVNHHISKIVATKVVANHSPWLSNMEIGSIHNIAVSHGEGSFKVADDSLKILIENSQIALQYVDFDGKPTMHPNFNPNGSTFAIEAITSRDGKILGKMGHSERYTKDLYKNIKGDKFQDIFGSGVKYFTD
ncbi:MULTISPECIES: phosphoribosylformylglycinamidine synthase [unclassified Gemella]|uniref:phosphoribosylformylglycinamidine synthase n=1 Tax=unclassified Gemella TaxID=2624949 RepID=UPI001C04B877|nr:MULTISPECIES: phosphoribosylformylglycinamidine synthase [unclassified Gemella]MBU0278983.1 phosphoribosylformylglycinamidine synthase [Gemella sp. zg-1178]QWQ38753.1 phosphoribosylformylglycinamidine synthase [Gemella sp. zg-570]